MIADQSVCTRPRSILSFTWRHEFKVLYGPIKRLLSSGFLSNRFELERHHFKVVGNGFVAISPNSLCDHYSGSACAVRVCVWLCWRFVLLCSSLFCFALFVSFFFLLLCFALLCSALIYCFTLVFFAFTHCDVSCFDTLWCVFCFVSCCVVLYCVVCVCGNVLAFTFVFFFCYCSFCYTFFCLFRVGFFFAFVCLVGGLVAFFVLSVYLLLLFYLLF